MDARGPAAAIACPRCGTEQPPHGDRMRSCLSCGLVFDATKASTTNLVARRKESTALSHEDEVKLVLPPTGLRRGQLVQVLAAVCFVLGIYLFGADRYYTYAAMQAVAVILVIVGRAMSAPWTLTVTPTHLLRQREWTFSSSLSRDQEIGSWLSDLDFDVDELRAALEMVPAQEAT